MQELVKEVTLKNHSNNGFAVLHGINYAFSLGGILSYNLRFQHISPTIHYYAGYSYKINTHYNNTGADEFVAWK